MAKMLFVATDSVHGSEVWVSDGTAAGTYLTKDIRTGSTGSTPANLFAPGNGTVLFSANDGTTTGLHGNELWVTDGTTAGTSLLADINSGTAGSFPSGFAALAPNKVLFLATDATHGAELWVTNGTAAGTSLVRDINATGTGASSSARYITPLGNGTAVFAANDGTTAGLHGFELWITDGSSTGTSLVIDINPGTASSNPSGITAIGNGKALFNGTDATHGGELWVTDGTAAGTSMVRDINPGPSGSTLGSLTPLGNGSWVFSATDVTHGRELWITDGTTAGTSMVEDINPSSDSSPTQFLSLGNGKLVFQATDGTHGLELWVTDGSSAGTSLVKDISAGPLDSSPQGFSLLTTGKALFEANDGSHGYQLWVTDGTGAGTSLIKSLYYSSGSLGSTPSYITPLGNGQALFRATDGAAAHGAELWITDGTASGTSLVKDINTSATGAPSNPAHLTLAALCFVAGTLIDTERGWVPVEQLRVGDIALTASGGTQPIVWIGQGRVLATRGRRGPATPVIVRKGALPDNVPHRDLHVTKGHSLFLDDALIPVEFLINHRTILWDDHAQEVEIYHIELERHDVLLANGAPAESYRDDGNRWLFQNANAGWDLPPKPPCAPVLTGGAKVDTVWRRLLDRAGPRTGLPLTYDPDLHLMVGSLRIDAKERTGNVYVFTLPDGAGDVRIVSRSAVPQELGVKRDPRDLGVALRRIVVRQGARFHTIMANDPALADGLHPFEPESGLRWTNGDAVVPAALTNRFKGPFELVVPVDGITDYVDDRGAEQAA